MSETFALNREGDVLRAQALIQSLFTQGTLGTRINAANKKLPWGYNRVFEIFNRKAKRIDAFEMDQLRALRRAREIEEATDELTKIDELRERLGRLEEFLALSDEGFHGPHIEALRSAARSMGGMAPRSRTGGERP